MKKQLETNPIRSGQMARICIEKYRYSHVSCPFVSDFTEVCRLVVQCNRQMGVDSSNSVNC